MKAVVIAKLCQFVAGLISVRGDQGSLHAIPDVDSLDVGVVNGCIVGCLACGM